MALRELGEKGRVGLDVQHGTVFAEWHPKLKGHAGPRVYREMRDNDQVIGSIFDLVELMLGRVSYPIQPADESPEAERWRDHVVEEIDGLEHTWREYLADFLTCLWAGYSLSEIVYRVRPDGLWGWTSFARRRQESVERWQMRGDKAVGFIQRPAPDYTLRAVPLDKCLHFTLGGTGNPQGRSMLRNAFTAYHYAKNLKTFEAISLERSGAGYPVLEVPPEMLEANADSEDVSALNNMFRLLRLIRTDSREGAVVPAEKMNGVETGYRFRLESPKASGEDFHRAITRHETRIAMVLHHELLFLGMDKGSSQALAETKQKVAVMASSAIAEKVASVFTRQAIHRLMEINGVPRPLWPSMTYGNLDDPKLLELAEALEHLVTSGLVQATDDDRAWVRETYGLPAGEQIEGEV